MLDSTDELGVIKKEEDLPDRIDGEDNRDLNLADRTRDPRLTPQEKARLQNCERPCSEEDWGAMPTALEWGTLGNLEFAYHGEMMAKIEVYTSMVAPMSAKPAPPKTTVHVQ